MKTTCWIILAAALAAISYGVYQHAEAAEARGQAQAADQQVARQAEVVDSVTREAERLDSIVQAKQRELADARAETEALADSLHRQTLAAAETATQAGDSVDATVDSLRVAVRPVVVPLVETLDRQVEAERDAHNSVADRLRRQLEITQTIVTQADSSAALCRRARTACADRVRELEGMVERMTTARDRWRDAADVGFLEGFSRSWRQTLTGAAIGVLGYALVN